MAKRRKKSTKRAELNSVTRVSNGAKRRRVGRRTVVGVVGAMLLFGLAAVGLAQYKKDWDLERDLSVIGNGKVTVVQIHDSGCSLCRRLQSNTRAALRGMGEDVQYRVADVNTGKGKAFQIRHGEPHVTLLLFDAKGRHKDTLSGVRESEDIRVAVNKILR